MNRSTWLGWAIGSSSVSIVLGILFVLGGEAGGGPVDLSPSPLDCQLPPLRCTGGEAHCRELVRFAPALGPGYADLPFNGETWEDQHASWIRRDLMLAIQHAAAAVECRTAAWRFGARGPIVLLDMSETGGATPGTAEGAPGHPPGTHVDGLGIDLTYYQAGVPDNRLRPVCASWQGGRDANHCLRNPDRLDAWRTALFVGILAGHPDIRVIGVDGRVGPRVEASLKELCRQGWLPATACLRSRLAYDTEDRGRGWFFSHHDHLHVAIER